MRSRHHRRQQLIKHRIDLLRAPVSPPKLCYLFRQLPIKLLPEGNGRPICGSIKPVSEEYVAEIESAKDRDQRD